VRKLAWAIVVLLLLVSAALFLRYVAIYTGLTDPKFIRQLRQQQADFSLYLSIAAGLLATLAVIMLAATHQRARERDYEDDDDTGPETCPECDEPIKGFAITCRACGYRFGPKFESRGV
jgi:hypothetical protein